MINEQAFSICLSQRPGKQLIEHEYERFIILN